MKLKELRFHEDFTRPGATSPIEQRRLLDFHGDLTVFGVEVFGNAEKGEQTYMVPWARVSFVVQDMSEPPRAAQVIPREKRRG